MVTPVTLVIILLLYLSFGLGEAVLIMATHRSRYWWHLAVVLVGLHLSVAVGVGFITLAGVAAETGVVMLVYLDQAWVRWREVAQAGKDERDADGLTRSRDRRRCCGFDPR